MAGKSPLNISEQAFVAELRPGRLTPAWDFLKRLLVLPHPQKENSPLFLLKPLVRKACSPRALFELGLHQCTEIYYAL